jgi:type IV secretory pathway VirB10-like protein
MSIRDMFNKILGKREPDEFTNFDSETEAELGDTSRNEHKPDEEQLNDTESFDDDVEAATFSNDDTKPAVKGFKKGAVYGAIGLIAFGSAAAMVMHNMDSGNNKTNSNQSSSSVGVNSANGGSVAGPDLGFDSYASMGQYDNEKKLDAASKKKTGAPGYSNAAGTQTVPQASGNNTVRQVPNRVGTGSYNASAPVSSGGGSSNYQSVSGNAGGSYITSSNNPYASAIAFALSGGDGGSDSVSDSSDSSDSSSSTTTSAPDYSSYTSADRVLLTGTLVPVTLITGIDSSLNGSVTAQVRENVYDSITGSSILIPAGSRLIGEYDGSGMNAGRVSVKFTRIMFPDGNSVALNNSLGVDAMGFGGVKDLYSEHTGKAVGASFITSLLAGIAGSSSDGSGTDNRSSGQEAINHAISNVLNTGNEIVKKKLEVGATAIIRPGFEFNVMLNSDLALEPYYGE